MSLSDLVLGYTRAVKTDPSLSIFAGGSLFVAKVALPHEQSLAGGIFNTLTGVGLASQNFISISFRYSLTLP